MIYTYGCSFTYGSGIRKEPNGNVFLGSDKFEDYTWTKQLEKLTNIELTNCGLGGTSNFWILDRVVEDLQLFKQGDIVILGETDIPRYNFPLGEGGIDDSGYLHMVPSTLEWIHNTVGETERQRSYGNFLVDMDDLKIIEDYYFYVFPKYIEFYKEKHLAKYNSLVSFLNNIGIQTVFWRCDVWSYFEKLNIWSSNYCTDGHWSPNGHADFAAIMHYCLDNKLNYLSYKNIEDIMKEADMPDSYIRFTKDDL